MKTLPVLPPVRPPAARPAVFGLRPGAAVLGLLASVLCLMPGLAFPPAPHHEIYGMVRDEFGIPLNFEGAEVTYINASDAELRAVSVSPGLLPNINYRLRLPMDAGTTTNAYKPNAVSTGAGFKLRVRLGQTTYLPIEMNGSLKTLGQPAQKTRLDLTLGEDVDGDGLPDAWERALIDFLGLNKTIWDINPNDDEDLDGRNNLAEYLAGTGFDLGALRVDIARFVNTHPVLKFFALGDRFYSVESSTNLTTWTSAPSRPAESGFSFADTIYSAEVQFLELEVNAGAATNRFFRIKQE